MLRGHKLDWGVRGLPLVGALALTGLVGALGCATGDPIDPSGSSNTGNTGNIGGDAAGGAGATGGVGANGGAGASGGAGAEGGGGNGGTGGVEPPPPGSPSTQTVSGGNVSTSPGYRMIHTFGQPTVNQGPNVSPSYQLVGGLVGANESLP